MNSYFSFGATCRVDMFVHQTWKESRLKLPDDIFEEGDDYVTLPPEFFDNLWQPDPYFLNSKIAGEWQTETVCGVLVSDFDAKENRRVDVVIFFFWCTSNWSSDKHRIWFEFAMSFVNRHRRRWASGVCWWIASCCNCSGWPFEQCILCTFFGCIHELALCVCWCLWEPFEHAKAMSPLHWFIAKPFGRGRLMTLN